MFRDWLVAVDKRFIGLAGLSILDLADYLWRDAYENGLSPDAAILDALDYWEDSWDVPAEIADIIREGLQ